MKIWKQLILASVWVVLGGCGLPVAVKSGGNVTAADPGIGKPIDLGETEPGPEVCEQIDQACVDENKRRIEALNTCHTEARSCRLQCWQPCGPEPIGSSDDFSYQEKHQNWEFCTAGQRECEDRCDASCVGLPSVQKCSSTVIAATCSRCADHPVARVKTCTWPAWPPIHPPGSPLVVPCDQDWSWAGTGACSACRAQTISEVQLGEQTCQCQYPDSQPAGQPWQRTCHFKPQLPELTP